MKAWIVRFVSLYVFNVALLLVLGAFLPNVQVGWSALWAAIILTAATIWLKPVLQRVFAPHATRIGRGKSTGVQKLVQYGLVFVVQLVIWILVVIFSGVRTQGVFWAWILPPIALAIGWIIYDQIDDAVERRAGSLYDSASERLNGQSEQSSSTPPADSAATRAGRDELKDGLTAEQRKMLDDLG